MNKIPTIIFIFLVLTSCSEKSFRVESRFNDGNYEVIYRPLSDTTIYGETYQRKFKIKFNESSDTLRKGAYVNEMALGEHTFYENNQIICKRLYVVPNPFFIDIDNKNETIDFSIYKIRPDSTYLNSAVFFDRNGDSVQSKSHYYKALITKTVGK